MSFVEDYPNLAEFFPAYFADADLLGMSDVEAIRLFVSENNKSTDGIKMLKDSCDELSALLTNIDLHWQSVSDEANRYFVSPADAMQWLKMVSKELSNLIK
ncbi:contact-dependent growth inhibition system immunity protein [Chitinophaga sedimenti]|uniref:contact-dependent growth inhibition system immunity protein n=1 Tax=Chitinophaga sedimenti TaxID=2033606 RepID=UPI002002BE41|nr:contact-dependent growth inhibition system immunity protein [Chitinophaga sedimenti]MCK7556239.1 contact-dependent growth inhibition system immunity protein [Chitinophaga sedimenti]